MKPNILVAMSIAALLAAAPAFAQHAPMAPSHAGVTLGAIDISGAFTRATLPNAPVGGGYFTLTNTGAEDDRLVAASSPAAGAVQMHEMAIENDIMKMRELPDGIIVPAGETVALEPGGLHLMFMKLAAPLVEGTVVPVTLTFEKAGEITIEVPVAGVGAQHAGHGAMTHADAAAHGSMAHMDQSGMTDIDAIRAMQTAMFNTPENPLDMGPVVISGEFAVSDWAQGGAGGRALLRKTAKGWGVHLCAGAGLKDAAMLISIGVPEADANALALQLAEAEMSLESAEIELYDSFKGTMMVDEELI